MKQFVFTLILTALVSMVNAQTQMTVEMAYWHAGPQYEGEAFQEIQVDDLHVLEMDFDLLFHRWGLGANISFAPTHWHFPELAKAVDGSMGVVEAFLKLNLATWMELRFLSRFGQSGSQDNVHSEEDLLLADRPLPGYFRYRSMRFGPGVEMDIPLGGGGLGLTLSAVQYFGRDDWRLEYEAAPQSTLVLPDVDERYSVTRTLLEAGLRMRWSSGFALWVGYRHEGGAVENGESRLNGPRVAASLMAR